MKKLGVMILSLALLFGMIPQAAMAAESSIFDEELTLYLSEISTERGFEVTKEDLEASLSTYGANLTYFTSVDDVRAIFADVIKSDLSNLNDLYETYALDEEALIQLLADNGEELNDYIFINDLDYAIYFYTEDNTFERDPNFDTDLVTFLATISIVRGFEVTTEHLAASLSIYGTALESFETVEELRDYLGEVIKADLSNLSSIYEMYEIDQETLYILLEQNRKDINDYIFVYDLGEVAYSGIGVDQSFDQEMLAPLLEQLDISEAELQNIAAYMQANEAYFSDPAFLEAFMSWTEQISLLEDLGTAGEYNEDHAKQVIAVFTRCFDLLKITPVISLIQEGIEAQMSFEALTLLKGLDYKTTAIKVAIYGTDSQFLADFFVTEEFIESFIGEISDDFGDNIEEKNEANNNGLQVKPSKTRNNSPIKTVKGAQLPKTSTNYIPSALFGLILAIMGIFMYKKVRNVNGEEKK